MEKDETKVIQKPSDAIALAGLAAAAYLAFKGWKMLLKDVWDLLPDMEDIEDEK